MLALVLSTCCTIHEFHMAFWNELISFLSLALQYGPIAHIDLKIPPRPPGYAFVEVSAENCLVLFILIVSILIFQ